MRQFNQLCLARATLLLSLVAVPLAATSQPTCISAPPGLIGWWRGEDNGNDSAGTNNAYALVNTSFTTGAVGRAFAFDPQNYPYGTYTGVQIADQPLYALTNSLSIEGWIRPRAAGYYVFYRGDRRGGLDPYAMAMGLNNVVGFGVTDAGGNSASVSAPVSYNRWWHVVGTLDGASGKMSLYTNGSLAAQITTTVRPFADLIPQFSPGIGIGNVNDGGNNFPFIGDIDEVSLYNRALSGAEVVGLFNAGAAGKCTDLVPPFIVSQPSDQTVSVGDAVHFSVGALGSSPLSYQWKKNGAELGGQTGTSLSIADAQLANAGTYSVVVTNSAGLVTSSNALLVVNPRGTCAVATSGLVSWWRGEGNATDSVDGADGSQYGGVSFAPGKVGQCFAFNGVNGAVNVPDMPALALTHSLTIEGWLFVTNAPSQPGMVLFRGDNRSGLDPYYVSLEPAAGTPGMLGFIICGSINVSDSVKTPMLLGAWTHMAATLDDGTGLMMIYTNGIVAAQKTTTVRPLGPLNSSYSPGIGIGNAQRQPGQFNYPFRGRIDELAVYNRALSAAEIGAIYTAGSEGKCHEPPVIVLQPTSRTISEAADTTFAVAATGTPELAYQWRLNGTNIGGATGTLLVLLHARTSDAGSYSVRVTNLFGETISFDAVLAVNRAPVAQCADVVAPAGTNCTAEASIDNGSFDPDGDPITVTQSPAGPYPRGTNAVTLTVIDSAGASNTCSALVIVQDQTPPQLVCPGSKLLEFQSEAGAVATFSASAADVCSAVGVVATPPSGSVFGIGVTPVQVRATDSSGNSDQCTFTVTVLGARGVKSNLLAELVALRSSAALSKSVAQKFDDATGHLAASLDPACWIDQTHLQPKSGNSAMDEEKLAAKTLAEIMDAKGCPIGASVLQDAINRIVRCDRLLAVISIQEAARAGLNSKKVEEDWDMVAKGDREAEATHYANAIEHYRNAWRHALQLQVKVGVNTDGSTLLQFIGNNSKSYRVDVSADFVNWTSLGTTTSDRDGNAEFIDSGTAGQPSRFYRVVEQ